MAIGLHAVVEIVVATSMRMRSLQRFQIAEKILSSSRCNCALTLFSSSLFIDKFFSYLFFLYMLNVFSNDNNLY